MKGAETLPKTWNPKVQVYVAHSMSLVVSTLTTCLQAEGTPGKANAGLVTSVPKPPLLLGQGWALGARPHRLQSPLGGADHPPPSSAGTVLTAQGPGPRRGPLFFRFCSSPSLGLFPQSGFFSLTTSGSEASACSLSPWIQLYPLLSGSLALSQHTLGRARTHAHTCAHTHTHAHTHTNPIPSAPSQGWKLTETSHTKYLWCCR